MSTFAQDLAGRLKEHAGFSRDYEMLRSSGAIESLRLGEFVERPELEDGVLERLLYSASILSQTDDDQDITLAQNIALSALLVSSQSAVYESATSILANLGNFPSVDFIKSNVSHQEPSVLNALQMHLLEVLNTVEGYRADRALTDFQLDVWRSLKRFGVLSVSAPTSAGKSFVVIEHLCKSIADATEFLGIYIAPTRALLGEVFKKLSLKLADVEGLRISTVPVLDPAGSAKQLYILTQERLSALLAVTDVSPNLMIVDEAQNIADGPRGMILQDCIERVKENNSDVQIILLSPGAEGFPAAMRTAGILDLELKETRRSPVLQNRILVHPVRGHARRLRLDLLEKGGRVRLGEVGMARGFENASTRLAAVALEFGKEDASLVYATGPAQSEKVASQLVLGLEKSADSQLSELSEFIKSHIHRDYGLAEMALHRVAFHYGRMPALLREAVERAFQEGHIQFLVCTTTLFQGINLPARNVFINTPTRGNGVKLDPALLWNFAGRAGRLSRDIVGNVFLIDYDSWEDDPMSRPVRLLVETSFSSAVNDHAEELVKALVGNAPKLVRSSEMPRQVRAAAGYILARASKGSLRATLDRLPTLAPAVRLELMEAADTGLGLLDLPSTIVEANWTVDLFGLARLQESLRQRLSEDTLVELIPCSPSDPDAYRIYVRVFNLIASDVLQYNVTTFGAFVANYALQWMRGLPYPQILGKWIKYKRKQRPERPIDPIIREAFDFIEEDLRFRWVQLGKAYISVLDHVLISRPELRASVFDFSLALELGVSTDTGRSLIELGLSRIAATTLESLYPDSAMTVEQAREALSRLDIRLHPISPVIVQELVSLELVRPTSVSA